MSLFEPAFAFILPHEGGYANDPDDPGGETKFGISKRSYPDLDIANLTLDEARAIYLRDYWNPQKYNEIVAQSVANKVFDMAVNMGFEQAHKLVQRACNDCGQLIVADGVLGYLSITAINNIPASELLEAIRARAVGFYQALAAKKPSNLKFLEGWLKRANA